MARLTPIYTLKEALPWFELESVDDLTMDELKRRFKKSLAKHHPDRGGTEGDFEKIVEAYEYVSTLVKRGMGGRDHTGVLDVHDVIKQRDRAFVEELNNLVSDVFDELMTQKPDRFQLVFNEQFEKQQSEAKQHWDEWSKQEYTVRLMDRWELSSRFDEERARRLEEEKEREKRHDDLPIDKDVKALEEAFMSMALARRYESTQKDERIILHPFEMAYFDGRTCGTDILCRDENTSVYNRPEYGNLSAVYSTDSIVFDKVPEYREHPLPSMEEIQQGRQIIAELTDDEKKELYEYDRRFAEKEEERTKKMIAFFASTKSSQWALMNRSYSNNVYDSQLGVHFPSCYEIKQQREKEKNDAMRVDEGDEKDNSVVNHTDDIIQRILDDINM